MKEKKTFQMLFLATVVILLVLPFVTTFNEFLTRIVENIGFYQFIQHIVVPPEVKLVIVVLQFFHIHAFGDDRVVFLMNQGKEVFKAQIIWSCVGWQSIVLLGFTFLTGMQGEYKGLSKFEVIVIGLFGTFWMNIFRISLVYIVGYYFGEFPSSIFHSYASTIMIIIWLFFFWWFSYKYLLEQKQTPVSLTE